MINENKRKLWTILLKSSTEGIKVDRYMGENNEVFEVIKTRDCCEESECNELSKHHITVL